MCLCPLEFAGLSLHLEILVAFRPAELEDFGIISNEGDTFGWVDRARAEVARLDPSKKSVFVESRALLEVQVPHGVVWWCPFGLNTVQFL